MNNYKSALVLAPHTDDAELGCGGSIAKLLKQGIKVHIVVFSSAKASVPQGHRADQLKIEFLSSMKKMGITNENLDIFDFPVRKLKDYRQEILEELIKIRLKVKPDLVFIPSSQDVHQDHQVVQEEGLRAFKNTTLLGYELPWNHITFSAQAFIKLSSEDIDFKWSCLEEYKTQLELGRSYFTKEFIYGLAKVRGTQTNSDYAEAFEVFRVII